MKENFDAEQWLRDWHKSSRNHPWLIASKLEKVQHGERFFVKLIPFSPDNAAHHYTIHPDPLVENTPVCTDHRTPFYLIDCIISEPNRKRLTRHVKDIQRWNDQTFDESLDILIYYYILHVEITLSFHGETPLLLQVHDPIAPIITIVDFLEELDKIDWLHGANFYEERYTSGATFKTLPASQYVEKKDCTVKNRRVPVYMSADQAKVASRMLNPHILSGSDYLKTAADCMHYYRELRSLMNQKDADLFDRLLATKEKRVKKRLPPASGSGARSFQCVEQNVTRFYSQAEIANQMGLKKDALRQRVTRFRKKHPKAWLIYQTLKDNQIYGFKEESYDEKFGEQDNQDVS